MILRYVSQQTQNICRTFVIQMFCVCMDGNNIYNDAFYLDYKGCNKHYKGQRRGSWSTLCSKQTWCGSINCVVKRRSLGVLYILVCEPTNGPACRYIMFVEHTLPCDRDYHVRYPNVDMHMVWITIPANERFTQCWNDDGPASRCWPIIITTLGQYGLVFL